MARVIPPISLGYIIDTVFIPFLKTYAPEAKDSTVEAFKNIVFKISSDYALQMYYTLDIEKKTWLTIIPSAFAISWTILKKSGIDVERIEEPVFGNTFILYANSAFGKDVIKDDFEDITMSMIDSLKGDMKKIFIGKEDIKEHKTIESYEESKLIGQGTYGCVYRKPLECKNKQTINKNYGNPDYLMKLAKVSSLKKELEISKMLRKIDPLQEYFLYLSPKGCSVKPSLVDLSVKCHVLNREPHEQYKGYILKYGGVTLRSFLDTHRDEISIDLIWNWFNKLIKALVLLRILGIIHQDIKLDNLVVNSKREIFLIDFGLSYKFDEKVDGSIKQFYSILPMFYSVLYGENAKMVKDAYQGLSEVTEIYNSIQNYIDTNGVENYKNNILKPNIFKTDIFSLGLVFVSIYETNKKIWEVQNKTKKDLFRKVILNMVNLNPGTLPDLEQITRFIQENDETLELKELSMTIVKTAEDKKRVLTKLCKIKDISIPESDVILYKDKKDDTYFCFTQDEISTLIPYYKNPKDSSRDVDSSFVKALRKIYR